MKYVSLDIETTGLRPKHDQVLQIGMIVDDTERPEVPREELPAFNAIINHEEFHGTPFALQLNSWIFRRLAGLSTGDPYKDSITIIDKAFIYAEWFDDPSKDPHFLSPVPLNPVLNFLVEYFPRMDRIPVAGKNAAGFDIPFLPKSITKYFDHRVIDPGSMYMESTDTSIPSLKLCKLRAGIEGPVTHEATDDCWDVIQLIRYKMEQV